MWHIGYHIWEIPQRDLEPNFDKYYVVRGLGVVASEGRTDNLQVLLSFQLLNIPILTLVKVSIIMLLLRGGGVIPWLKKVLYGIMMFTIGASMVPWCIYIFICKPLTGNTWNPRTFGHMHCITRWQMGEMLIWVTSSNLLTDLLILPIPFIIVRRMMSARLQSKLVVLAVFICGVT